MAAPAAAADLAAEQRMAWPRDHPWAERQQLSQAHQRRTALLHPERVRSVAAQAEPLCSSPSWAAPEQGPVALRRAVAAVEARAAAGARSGRPAAADACADISVPLGQAVKKPEAGTVAAVPERAVAAAQAHALSGPPAAADACAHVSVWPGTAPAKVGAAAVWCLPEQGPTALQQAVAAVEARAALGLRAAADAGTDTAVWPGKPAHTGWDRLSGAGLQRAVACALPTPTDAGADVFVQLERCALEEEARSSKAGPQHAAVAVEARAAACALSGQHAAAGAGTDVSMRLRRPVPVSLNASSPTVAGYGPAALQRAIAEVEARAAGCAAAGAAALADVGGALAAGAAAAGAAAGRAAVGAAGNGEALQLCWAGVKSDYRNHDWFRCVRLLG